MSFLKRKKEIKVPVFVKLIVIAVLSAAVVFVLFSVYGKMSRQRADVAESSANDASQLAEIKALTKTNAGLNTSQSKSNESLDFRLKNLEEKVAALEKINYFANLSAEEKSKLSTYTNTDLNIKFTYPSYWGEVVSGKFGTFFFTGFDGLGFNIVSVSANEPQDSSYFQMGMSRGVLSYDMLDESYVKNFCADSFILHSGEVATLDNCTVFNNKAGIPVAKANMEEFQGEAQLYFIFNDTNKNSGVAIETLTKDLQAAVPEIDKQVESLVQSITFPVKPTAIDTRMPIKVYFGSVYGANCSDSYWVLRKVAKTSDINLLAESALEQLFKGPTAAEKEKYQSKDFWITEKDLSYLKRVFVKNGTAYLDWGNIKEIAGDASTSCGKEMFFGPIAKTLKFFPEIKNVVHAINGSPKAFYIDFMEMACPVYDGNNNLITDCDATPFK